MSKIMHSDRQYNVRRQCETKPGPNRAKGWLADHTTLAGRLGFGVFSKSIFNTCQLQSARRVSDVEKAVLPQILAAQPC
jgi:hypothetical protein